jgi:hypothetical protein
MSDQNGQEIGVNVYDDEDELIEGEEAAAPQPVEVVREEILTVTRNTGTEEKVSMMGNAEESDGEDDVYELVKAQPAQLSKLADIVESLQSQIEQLGETGLSGRKTSSTRRSRSMKTKNNKATSKKTKGRSKFYINTEIESCALDNVIIMPCQNFIYKRYSADCFFNDRYHKHSII